MKVASKKILGLTGAIVARAAGETGPVTTLHEQVYQTVREALTVGRFAPGKSISLRNLAEALNVGIMPARDAIRRLSAEHALEVGQNRRVHVPMMTAQRFEELMRARLLLEPECAIRALPNIDAARIARIRTFDDAMNRSYSTGDAEQYMASNYGFHFEIYRAAESDVMVPLLESIWLRFGPFMRTVYSMASYVEVIDKHALAIDAIERRDEAALKAAIEGDIRDGMHFLGESIFPVPERRGRLN